MGVNEVGLGSAGVATGVERPATDVLVLGGGVIGLACALELLRAGRGVTVIERGEVGAGASHGNCGTITPSHAPPLAMPGQVRQALRWMFTPDAPFRIAPRLDPALIAWMLRFAARCNETTFRDTVRAKGQLLLAARAALGELVAREALDCEWEEQGTLGVWRTHEGFEKAQWLPPLLHELGLRCDVLDGASVRQLEPAVHESIVGGVRHGNDARLRPERYLAALLSRVREAGGEVRERTTVLGFERMGGKVSKVRTSAGEFSGRDIVFALGAWSPKLAAELGIHLPIQPGKGYSITFNRTATAPRLPLVFKERMVCATGWESGLRLGSTMEFAGYDESLNRVRLDALRRAAGEYLVDPPIDDAGVEEWYGWRPMVYDDLPIIGRAPALSNLMLATGHGMLGVTESAITARLVSDLVTGREPVMDPAPYRPSRFT
jgi:D-amino-acid dehydrogenase